MKFNEEELLKMKNRLIYLEESINRRTTLYSYTLVFVLTIISITIFLSYNNWVFDDTNKKYCLIIVALNFIVLQRLLAFIILSIVSKKSKSSIDSLNSDINNLEIVIIKDKLAKNEALDSTQEGKLYAIYLKENSNFNKSQQFINSNINIFTNYLKLDSSKVASINEHVYDSNTIEIVYTDGTTKQVDFTYGDVINIMKEIIMH